MAAPPILLVADDLSVIASVKRVLAREGYECVLATSAADAVIAFGHLLPGLIVLQPSVESDRGGVLLEELQGHPDAKLLRVLVLGETVPGFAWPVVPLPLDPEYFAAALDKNIRTSDEAGSWSVLEPAPVAPPPPLVEQRPEVEAWRATGPQEVGPGEGDGDGEDMPEPQAIVPDPTPPEPGPLSADALEERLFGDLAADVEASAMESVESSLPQPLLDQDEELNRLEDEVRAEAQRRRASREARAVTVKPALPAPTPPSAGTPSAQTGEESFESLSESPAPSPSRANEVLSRAEQMVLESRAQSEAHQRAEEADVRALREATSHAEGLLRSEREARAASDEQLFSLRDEVQRLTSDFANERELSRVRHENELETLNADAEAEAQKAAELERALDEAKEHGSSLETDLEEVSAQVAAARAEAGKRAVLEEQLEAATTRVTELETQVAELQVMAAVATEEQAKREAIEEIVATRDGQIDELTHALEAAVARANGAQVEMRAIEGVGDSLNTQLTEANGRLEALQADVTSASELLEDTAKERDTLRTRVATLEPYQPLAEKLGAELDAETRRRTGVEAELEDAKRSLEATRTKADSLEATAVLAVEKVKVLEAREVMSLSLPGKHAVGVARHGSVDLEGLARVVAQLVLGNAEARLELGTAGGTRTLWLKRGQIIAAESPIDHEGLISRARRDGLIDTRQDAELRMLKGATPREQLEALKSRGFIRDIESVPLVQRYTEQVALDAFTEEQTIYRVVEEAPKPDVLLATVPRPTLPMLAESLRRAVAPDVMLEKLGGGEAVPVATDSELDLRALGFSERERKMITWVDGEATIEDLSLASGLKPDLAFRALLVAQLLGIIEVRPGVKKTEPSSGQLDLHRLEAKFDEVQDADYFTILGISRAAGTEEVRRAFQRLAQEFDPLRFSGHPDPSIQQRAQVVARLLEEAARALEDDRRRVEYARHLLD